MDINKIQLLLNDRIETAEFGTLYFPDVEYLIEHGEVGFNRLVLPYALTTDAFGLDEELLKEVTMFDLLLQPFQYDENTKLYDIFMDSLRFYFKLEPVYVQQYYCVCVGDYIINRDNFDRLAEIILLISKTQKVKVEKPPKFENAVQKDVYEKITEGRRREAQKNRISFATIINVVMNGGVKTNYISAEQVRKMTFYQLMSRYDFIMETESWEVELGQVLSPKIDSKKIDLTYWIHKIKI